MLLISSVSSVIYLVVLVLYIAQQKGNPGHPTHQNTAPPPPKKKNLREPPRHSPAGPQIPSKKRDSRPRAPSKSVPPGVPPEPLHGEDPFGSIHFLTRACFFCLAIVQDPTETFLNGLQSLRASPTYPVSAGAFKQALSNLRPQKTTKRQKNWNFRPREAREFLGRWDRNSNTVKTQKFHTSGVCLREDKKSGTKIGQ